MLKHPPSSLMDHSDFVGRDTGVKTGPWPIFSFQPFGHLINICSKMTWSDSYHANIGLGNAKRILCHRFFSSGGEDWLTTFGKSPAWRSCSMFHEDLLCSMFHNELLFLAHGVRFLPTGFSSLTLVIARGARARDVSLIKRNSSFTAELSISFSYMTLCPFTTLRTGPFIPKKRLDPPWAWCEWQSRRIFCRLRGGI